VKKIAARAAQLANCILLHAYLHLHFRFPTAQSQQKLHKVYLISWHNSIFDYKLEELYCEAENYP